MHKIRQGAHERASVCERERERERIIDARRREGTSLNASKPPLDSRSFSQEIGGNATTLGNSLAEEKGSPWADRTTMMTKTTMSMITTTTMTARIRRRWRNAGVRRVGSSALIRPIRSPAPPLSIAVLVLLALRRTPSRVTVLHRAAPSTTGRKHAPHAL